MPRIEENSSASVASGVVRRTTWARADEAAATSEAAVRMQRVVKGSMWRKDAPPRSEVAGGSARPPPPVPEEEDRHSRREEQRAASGVARIGPRRADDDVDRSEERRVGKECRSRWSP